MASKAIVSRRSYDKYFSKVFWIYLVAFLLVAFNFSTHAAEKTKKNQKTSEEGKKKDMIAIFETNLGSFKVKLHSEKTPLTVDNFVGLAEGTKEWTDPKTGKKSNKKFYDGITFHRVISGFMIQGGDPLGNGTGGPGYTFKDEFDKSLRFDHPGVLAMANAGPSTNGSQFFVTVAELPRLNDKHTIFGDVVDGMDIVYKIAKTPTGAADRPVEPVVIKTITIQK